MVNHLIIVFSSLEVANSIMVLVFFTSSFQDMAPTGIYYNKWLWGDNYVTIQGMIMVHMHCPFSHCRLSTN